MKTERDKAIERRGMWLIAVLLATLVALAGRLIWIGRHYALAVAILFLASGCFGDFNLVKYQPCAKCDASQPTTQPAVKPKRSFVDLLLEDML